MENKESEITTQDVFCISCGTKNSGKNNFCLNCGHALKKDINANEINNNQSNVSFKEENQEKKKKGLFGNGIFSRGIGIFVVIYFSLLFSFDDENYFILLIPIVSAILYFKYPTMKKIIDVVLDVIGKLVLAYFIFILLLLGACFFPLIFS